MSTNDLTTDNDPGRLDDPPRNCPVETVETVLDVCARLLDRAVTPTTTTRARDVADETTALNSTAAGYALTALATDPETVASRLDQPPTVHVTVLKKTQRCTRYELEPSLRGDGGTILVCPECDTGGLERRESGEWYCSACHSHFDEPIERPDQRFGPKSTPLTTALDDVDPDDIVTDGGVPVDAGAADEPTWNKASTYLSDAQLAQLDTLVDIGIYTSRSEALRSAVRREIRFQAEDPDDVAQQLQRVYDRAMQGRRPETIGSTERLAELLGVRLTRPEVA